MERIDALSETMEQLKEAKKQVAPLAAQSLVEIITDGKQPNELLRLVGVLSGQNITAEELIIALHKEMSSV